MHIDDWDNIRPNAHTLPLPITRERKGVSGAERGRIATPRVQR